VSISQSIWGTIFDRLKKHSVHHLIIPLAGGFAVEWLVHKFIEYFFGHNKEVADFVSTLGFRSTILVLGVGISWLIVMFFMIRHETSKRVEENSLAILEENLKKAIGYHGVSVIRLTEWFDPALLLYVTRLMRHKLDANNLRHERTLLFFSDREEGKSKVELTDEYYYGRCLARMHLDLRIPLSFLTRKDIFDLLEDVGEKEKAALCLYPRWTNWRFLKKAQEKIPLRHLRLRIPSLDFALLSNTDGTTTVLQFSKHGEKVNIKAETTKEKVKPFEDVIKKIKGMVYESDRLRASHNFLSRYWADSDWVSNHHPRAQPAPPPALPPVLSRREITENLAIYHQVAFRVRRYCRFVDIAEGSGDMTVYEQYEGVTAYPNGSFRSEMPRTFSSRFGYLCDPQITKSEGTSVGWKRAPAPRGAAGLERGFITFDPPIENDPVSFELQRTTHNAFHFNQRDRQVRTEQVAGHMDNLNDQYVLKVRFPQRSFPPRFNIHVTKNEKPSQEDDTKNNQQKRAETDGSQAGKPFEPDKKKESRNYEEEKRALSRFSAFALDRTAVLILERPLPGHTYRVIWELPKDDVDEMALSPQEARILRNMVKRLLSLGSNPAMAENVKQQLGELQKQIAGASVGSHSINDPGLEVVLHTYDDEKKALVMVAANTPQESAPVEIGQSTVGQAYKRRTLVSWPSIPHPENVDFWDFGKGHSGIVSIPLFFPLKTNTGGRTCVLSLATKRLDSGFLELIDQLDDRKLRKALTQHVNAWYAISLAGALGLPDLSKDALNRTTSLEEGSVTDEARES
jgi:hypothetical protein